MGVQVIGGPDIAAQTVSLDDLKVGAEAKIDGYGDLLAADFSFKDRLGHYRQGRSDVWSSDDYNQSGTEADYALLRMDITNTSIKSYDFLTSCEVKAVYDDVYEYGGWCRQYNYDNGTSGGSSYGEDSKKQNTNWVIDKADQFAIEPMYQGHYVFGCTLPNAVVNSKKPLRMEIKLDGNELIYNIRK